MGVELLQVDKFLANLTVLNKLNGDVMNPRINPLNITIDKGNNTTSHIEDTSYCPVCNNKMRELTANGIPVNACLIHNVALPVKDDE